MLATFLQYLHVTPMAFMVLLFAVSALRSGIIEKIGSEVFMALLLILASLGLAAGHFIHENGFEHVELFDPCYGYVATLLGVALKLFRNKLAAKTF